MPRKNKTPHVRRISPGTRMFLLTIYPPWLLNVFPYSYWASTCLAALPTYSASMISVRQASDLPPASFRFPVAQDTLTRGYILPAVGRIRDFHPLKHAPAGRINKTGPSEFLLIWSGSVCQIDEKMTAPKSLKQSFFDKFHDIVRCTIKNLT